MKKIMSIIIGLVVCGLFAMDKRPLETTAYNERFITQNDVQSVRRVSSSEFKAFITPAKNSSDGTLKRSKRLDAEPISHNNLSKDQ